MSIVASASFTIAYPIYQGKIKNGCQDDGNGIKEGLEVKEKETNGNR